MEICLTNQRYIPECYRLEMQGVADGAGNNVTYGDVLLLNEGLDVLISVIYPLIFAVEKMKGAIPLPIISIIPKLPLELACNQFAVFGEGTTDSGLFHGRDFMFPSLGILQEYALVRVAEPDERYPFIGVTAPGFVGVYEGMNIHGVSIGTNMVSSWDCVPFRGGKGTLFVCRDVVQYASTLAEGIERVREAPKRTSWIYLISDGKIPDTAVLETSTHFFKIRGDRRITIRIRLKKNHS